MHNLQPKTPKQKTKPHAMSSPRNRKTFECLAKAVLWAFAMSLVAALPAAAEPSQTSSSAATPAWDDPTFFIESIEIKGLERARVGPILSQLRLVEGTSYPESELQRAIFRLKRLAFVHDATMRLARGSVRDRYVLEISVVETSRFFLLTDQTYRYQPSYDYDLDLDIFGDPELTGTIRATAPSTWNGEGDFLTVGGRHFLGSNGLAFATLSPDAATVGYTHYNLFGPGSFSTVAVRKTICCDGSSSRRTNDLGVEIIDDLETTLAFGIPLARDHSLQLNLTWANGDDSEILTDGSFFGLERETLGADLRWFYDTTDDPFLPERGFRASAGLGAFSTDESYGSDRFSYSSERDQLAASLSAIRYYDRGSFGTLWLGLGASLIEVDESQQHDQTLILRDQLAFTRVAALDTRKSVATASAGWAKNLLERNGKNRALRLETGLDLNWYDNDDPRYRFFPFWEESRVQFEVALAFRNRWSVVRFGVGYQDGGHP